MRRAVAVILALWLAPLPSARAQGSEPTDGAGSSEPSDATNATSTATSRDDSARSATPVVVVREAAPEPETPEEEPRPDPHDILWIELFGGASYTDLRAIDATNYFPEVVRLSGWGPGGGVAVGFRIDFVSVGVRGALARYDVSDATSPDAVFDVGTLAAEVKLALPFQVVQPFVRVGFGLGWHGNSNIQDVWTTGEPPMNVQTTVFGWVFQGAVGLDVYLTHWFAIGAAFSMDLLNMSRQPIEESTDISLRMSGDAIGMQLRGQGAISFHF